MYLPERQEAEGETLVSRDSKKSAHLRGRTGNCSCIACIHTVPGDKAGAETFKFTAQIGKEPIHIKEEMVNDTTPLIKNYKWEIGCHEQLQLSNYNHRVFY